MPIFFNGQRVYTRNHVGILKDEELLFQRPCQGRDKKCSEKPLKRPSQARKLHRKWNVAFLKIEQNFIPNRYKSKRVDIDEDSKHKQTNKQTNILIHYKRRKYDMGLCKNSKEEVGRHVPGTAGRRLTKA